MDYFKNITLNDIKTEKSETIENDLFETLNFEENMQSPFQESGCLKYKSAIQSSKKQKDPIPVLVSFNEQQLEQHMCKSLNYQEGTGLFTHLHLPTSKQNQNQRQLLPLTFEFKEIKNTYNTNKKSQVSSQQLFQKYINESELQQKHKKTQNLNKFFQYIYDFKTCKIGSYSPRNKSFSICSRNQQQFNLNIKETVKSQVYQINVVNENTNDQNSNINISQKSCSSTYSNGQTKLVFFNNKQANTLIDEKSLYEKQVHFGFECNHCRMDPIVGQRYRCQFCDFDLCKQCYFYTQSSLQIHEHEMFLVRLQNNRQQNMLQKVLIKSLQFKNKQKGNFNNQKGVKSTIIHKRARESINQASRASSRKTIVV